MTGELLCSVLEECGFETHGCGDGISALAAAAARCFDCAITDYRMPKMNGVELTRHLRGRFPALLIIGVSIQDKKKEFLEAGADGFRLKPLRLGDIETLRCLLRIMR
jgi:CheY-like chemotaxis protein